MELDFVTDVRALFAADLQVTIVCGSSSLYPVSISRTYWSSAAPAERALVPAWTLLVISDPQTSESNLSVFTRAQDVTGDAASALRDRVSADLDVDLPLTRAKIDDPTRPLARSPFCFVPAADIAAPCFEE